MKMRRSFVNTAPGAQTDRTVRQGIGQSLFEKRLFAAKGLAEFAAALGCGGYGQGTLLVRDGRQEGVRLPARTGRTRGWRLARGLCAVPGRPGAGRRGARGGGGHRRRHCRHPMDAPPGRRPGRPAGLDSGPVGVLARRRQLLPGGRPAERAAGRDRCGPGTLGLCRARPGRRPGAPGAPSRPGIAPRRGALRRTPGDRGTGRGLWTQLYQARRTALGGGPARYCMCSKPSPRSGPSGLSRPTRKSGRRLRRCTTTWSRPSWTWTGRTGAACRTVIASVANYVQDGCVVERARIRQTAPARGAV